MWKCFIFFFFTFSISKINRKRIFLYKITNNTNWFLEICRKTLTQIFLNCRMDFFLSFKVQSTVKKEKEQTKYKKKKNRNLFWENCKNSKSTWLLWMEFLFYFLFVCYLSVSSISIQCFCWLSKRLGFLFFIFLLVVQSSWRPIELAKKAKLKWAPRQKEWKKDITQQCFKSKFSW